MKLRLRGNSARLRLLKAEVARLLKEGAVEERVDFGPSALRYRVELSGSDNPEVSFQNQEVLFRLPAGAARAWAQGAGASWSGEQPLPSGGQLRWLVEKDFACLNPNAVWQEDQSDNYPNPHPSCGGTHGGS